VKAIPGCPSCRSERLKGAPLPLVSPMADLLFSRRRYRCSDCKWRGWKHRMRRLGKPTSLIIDTEPPQARATVFFVLLVGLFLTASVMLVRSCAPSEQQLPAIGATGDAMGEGLT
jgi:hypothetical protein